MVFNKSNPLENNYLTSKIQTSKYHEVRDRPQNQLWERISELREIPSCWWLGRVIQISPEEDPLVSALGKDQKYVSYLYHISTTLSVKLSSHYTLLPILMQSFRSLLPFYDLHFSSGLFLCLNLFWLHRIKHFYHSIAQGGTLCHQLWMPQSKFPLGLMVSYVWNTTAW